MDMSWTYYNENERQQTAQAVHRVATQAWGGGGGGKGGGGSRGRPLRRFEDHIEKKNGTAYSRTDLDRRDHETSKNVGGSLSSHETSKHVARKASNNRKTSVLLGR